jgi:cell shape-determining protein MreD
LLRRQEYTSVLKIPGICWLEESNARQWLRHSEITQSSSGLTQHWYLTARLWRKNPDGGKKCVEVLWWNESRRCDPKWFPQEKVDQPEPGEVPHDSILLQGNFYKLTRSVVAISSHITKPIQWTAPHIMSIHILQTNGSRQRRHRIAIWTGFGLHIGCKSYTLPLIANLLNFYKLYQHFVTISHILTGTIDAEFLGLFDSLLYNNVIFNFSNLYAYRKNNKLILPWLCLCKFVMRLVSVYHKTVQLIYSHLYLPTAVLSRL